MINGIGELEFKILGAEVIEASLKYADQTKTPKLARWNGWLVGLKI